MSLAIGGQPSAIGQEAFAANKTSATTIDTTDSRKRSDLKAESQEKEN